MDPASYCYCLPSILSDLPVILRSDTSTDTLRAGTHLDADYCPNTRSRSRSLIRQCATECAITYPARHGHGSIHGWPQEHRLQRPCGACNRPSASGTAAAGASVQTANARTLLWTCQRRLPSFLNHITAISLQLSQGGCYSWSRHDIDQLPHNPVYQEASHSYISLQLAIAQHIIEGFKHTSSLL
jgi:hypothetical protein